MIAGNDGDCVRLAEPREPRCGLAEFLRQAEMGEIAGYRDVVEVFRVQIGAERIQHVGPVLVAPPQPPRNVAEDPFVEQCARAHAFERRQMQIGQVRQHEIGVRRRAVTLIRVDFQFNGRHAVSI